MLVEVGIASKKIYENEFEKPFIAETQAYYRSESHYYITAHSCFAYLQKANQRLNEELERVLNYLDASSERVLIQTFLREYVENHAATLVGMENSGLVHMIRNDKFQEIELMHSLFAKVPEAFAVLNKQLAAFIAGEGNKLLADEKLRNDEYIARVIELRDKVLTIFQRSFNRDAAVEMTIKAAFEQFVNQNDRTAMSLVYYLDDQFKRDFKGLSEQLVNERLDKVIQIFRYLQDKDIFEGFYKNSLAKRLLEPRASPEEAEKALVLKLKEECGFQFTQKLEVMFKDIRMSEDTMLEFKSTTLAKQLSIDLSVKVLTTGNWPNEAKDAVQNVQLPREIAACVQAFNKFYNSKHTGRLLHWKPSLGSADLKATLGEQNNKYELQASTYQACILLLFNQAPSVTYQQILERTQIQEIDVKCCLMPMIGKLLVKSPGSKDFAPADVYSVNPAFKSG